MTPPLPAPMTSDEHEPRVVGWLARLLSRVLAASLAAWATIRRAAMGMLAVVIMLAVAGLAGYALGRHSVAPKPGEEARLDSTIAVLAARADSLEQVAAWERAQRVLLEQKAASMAAVEVEGPGRVRIIPRDPKLAPRVVDIPTEVTAALSLERQINASLRVELDAEHQRAETEKARADSLERARDLARAVRYPWIVAGIGGGRDLTARAWDVSADVSLRVSDRWSVRADVVQALARGEDPRARVYAHREWRWP